jgi:hypothetical protein
MESHESLTIFAGVNQSAALDLSNDLVAEILNIKFLFSEETQSTRKSSGNQNIVSMRFGLLIIPFRFVSDLSLTGLISVHC